MNVTSIFFGILFITIGVLFACKKGYFFTNTVNIADEDLTYLCRNVGEIIVLNGIIFLLKGVCPGFNNHWFTGCMIAWFIIAGLDVWYLRRDLK